MTPVVYVLVGIRAYVEVYEDEGWGYANDVPPLSRSLSAHVKEISKRIRYEKADKAEYGRTGANTVCSRCYAGWQEISADAGE